MMTIGVPAFWDDLRIRRASSRPSMFGINRSKKMPSNFSPIDQSGRFQAVVDWLSLHPREDKISTSTPAWGHRRPRPIFRAALCPAFPPVSARLVATRGFFCDSTERARSEADPIWFATPGLPVHAFWHPANRSHIGADSSPIRFTSGAEYSLPLGWQRVRDLLGKLRAISQRPAQSTGYYLA